MSENCLDKIGTVFFVYKRLYIYKTVMFMELKVCKGERKLRINTE